MPEDQKPDVGQIHRVAVGVMGSAGGALTSETLQKVRRLGEAIARRGYVLITGAYVFPRA